MKTIHDPTLKPILQWFTQNNWKPWPFQLQAWNSYLKKESGLITVPTGAGKTYAVFLGPLALLHQQKKNRPSDSLHHTFEISFP